MANTDVAGLQVSLPQMLDLALGTPELGAVNLNILHNFLHVLLHQIDLKTTKVEYRGDEAKRIQTMVSSLKSGPSLHLQEYSITDGSGETTHRSPDDKGIAADVIGNEASKKSKGVKQKVGPEVTTSEAETVIFVEPIVDGACPTALGFKQLEQSVSQLQKQFQALEELSTNPDLVERLKGKIADPLTDMWQIININKRLDASEQGIDKLTTMVQDCIKSDPNAMAPMEETEDDDESPLRLVTERLDLLEEAYVELKYQLEVLMAEIVTEGTEPEPTRTESPSDAEPSSEVPSALSAPPAQEPSEPPPLPPPIPRKSSLARGKLPSIDFRQLEADVGTLKTEVVSLRKDLVAQVAVGALTDGKPVASEQQKSEALAQKSQQVEGTPATKTVTANVGTTNQQTVVSEGNRDDCMERCMHAMQDEMTRNDETAHGDLINKINERVKVLEGDVASLMEKIPEEDAMGNTGEEELNELIAKVQGIQMEMERLTKTTDHLLNEQENREMHLNALLEQVDLLKTVKADKEDLEDALADKADAQVVNRKVSHDQFDTAYDELARGLEDAIGKLGKQENIWQQALDDVQKDISTKVDKVEMSPLKDFVNDRLKSVQDKLKHMIEMKRENEAAATKKLLRDVNCISCDKGAVMRMEESGKYHPDPLPGSTSMKPYLTYELDQVRKLRKKLPHGKNMLHLEAALQEESKKTKIPKEERIAKSPRDHLCNRYCGGSHTVTTPHQRVTRLGHYLTQWGPETVQLTEGQVEGTDGQLYRSRRVAAKGGICGMAGTPCEANRSGEEPKEISSCADTLTRKADEVASQEKNGSQKKLIKK